MLMKHNTIQSKFLSGSTKLLMQLLNSHKSTHSNETLCEQWQRCYYNHFVSIQLSMLSKSHQLMCPIRYAVGSNRSVMNRWWVESQSGYKVEMKFRLATELNGKKGKVQENTNTQISESKGRTNENVQGGERKMSQQKRFWPMNGWIKRNKWWASISMVQCEKRYEVGKFSGSSHF